MVAKVVLGMIFLLVFLALITGAAFLYFREKEKHNHEKEMRRMERDEKIWDELE